MVGAQPQLHHREEEKRGSKVPITKVAGAGDVRFLGHLTELERHKSCHDPESDKQL